MALWRYGWLTAAGSVTCSLRTPWVYRKSVSVYGSPART